jgi:hypothetical protein
MLVMDKRSSLFCRGVNDEEKSLMTFLAQIGANCHKLEVVNIVARIKQVGGFNQK